ncbi:hypothetical protein QVD17_16521 [Tagetes erecta]|uniref:Uncharacterized protein n=1 Tax=Tagetes erecta TaxID=13708 RepID=A0AAD8KY21_TARER|nr:hypothetical protein QVD17_16521 [Tagetes erecta]
MLLTLWVPCVESGTKLNGLSAVPVVESFRVCNVHSNLVAWEEVSSSQMQLNDANGVNAVDSDGTTSLAVAG